MSNKKGRSKKREHGNQGNGHDQGRSEQESSAAQRKLLIEAWKARDELYRQLFGEYTHVNPSAYAPPSEIVLPERDTNTAHGGSADPGDPTAEEQHLAVLAYGPDPLRPYWTYVTAGLCSPWLQDESAEVSGFGCELMIKSPVDAKWPAQILRSMAFYIFNHAGTLAPGARIGLNAPIKEHSDSLLRNLFIWYADEAPDCWYTLPSGGFGLFCAVGITEDELKYAESVGEYGTWCIQEVLNAVNIRQTSDPDRKSVITDENTERLAGARTFALNFGADLAPRQLPTQDD